MLVNFSKQEFKNNNLKLDGHLLEIVALLHVVNDSLINNVQYICPTKFYYVQ